MRDPLRPETLTESAPEPAPPPPVRRVGLVGTGYFAAFHARAWQRLDGANLAGLVAEHREDGARFVTEQSLGELSVYDSVVSLAANEMPDIVDLVTPPHSHVALVRECLIAGVPLIVCQKPFCTDPDEAEALADEIDASDSTVVVHENFRFQPWYQEIGRLLSRGVLGRVYSVRFDLRPGDGQSEEAYLNRQPYFRTQPEFLIRETGVHYVDVFRSLFGEVEGVFARLAQLNPVIVGEDAGTVLMEFAHGVRATLDGNRLADHAADNPRLVMGELRIEGEDGTLTLNGDGRILLRAHGEKEPIAHTYAFEDVDFGGDCVYRCNEHILAHVNTGSPLQNTAREYLVNRRLEALIYRSHHEQRWLDANGIDERQ